jgi:hypothetical protein
MMSLIRNERLKYLATLVNTAAAGILVTGVVAPVIAFTYGLTSPFASGPGAILMSLLWLASAVPYIMVSG